MLHSVLIKTNRIVHKCTKNINKTISMRFFETATVRFSRLYESVSWREMLNLRVLTRKIYEIFSKNFYGSKSNIWTEVRSNFFHSKVLCKTFITFFFPSRYLSICQISHLIISAVLFKKSFFSVNKKPSPQKSNYKPPFQERFRAYNRTNTMYASTIHVQKHLSKESQLNKKLHYFLKCTD